VLEKVNEILNFWFGSDERDFLSQSHKWWRKDSHLDQEIRERFEGVHLAAIKGDLAPWVLQPRSCLAYIILLDQFSRNMYRGLPLAFAQDSLALQAACYARDQKFDKELSLVHRIFFYMPFEHSEEINDQKLCLILMQQLIQHAKETAPEYLQTTEETFAFAQKHYDIILNFGRFPHRNGILNRESTQDELLFLSLPNSHFLMMERERVRWACRRGMLELDLFLVPFFEKVFSTLSEEDKARFVLLLKEEDPLLLAWLMQEVEPENKDIARIVEEIRKFRILHGPHSLF